MHLPTLGGLAGIVFDAYGTLFDISALDVACAAVTDAPDRLAALWRAKQLEYAFVRTAIDRYADWNQITSDALDYACAARGVRLDPSRRQALMRAWLELPPYADVPPALARLDGRLPLLILSNGTQQMLRPLVARAQLTNYFLDILSSEDVHAFKPDPHIYGLAPDRLRAHIYELLFVTANGFDLAGAKSVGFTVCRVNRAGLPLDGLGFEPDMTVRALDELADALLGAAAPEQFEGPT